MLEGGKFWGGEEGEEVSIKGGVVGWIWKGDKGGARGLGGVFREARGVLDGLVKIKLAAIWCSKH